MVIKAPRVARFQPTVKRNLAEPHTPRLASSKLLKLYRVLALCLKCSHFSWLMNSRTLCIMKAPRAVVRMEMVALREM